jgi:large subunit ribosomal protein L24
MEIKRWERKDVKPNSLPVVKKLHVKVGDNVKVIGGADKGKISTVTRIYTHNSKVLLKDINLKTKHVKGKAEGEIGQIVQVEAPVHSSNVMLYSKTAKVTSRVGHKVLETGQKVRYLLKTGEIIDSAEEWKKVHKKDKKDAKRP